MTKLKNYFPMIRTKEEIMKEINNSPALVSMFYNWKPEHQQEFLDFCTGVRGLKILYDPFFKEVFNPEYAPERLEQLLSLILGQKVHILQVLPNDSTRLADESSLLITDIVVELEDHSIANIEIQKLGYLFPGQRCACYSSDLLLRQYKRIRSEKKKKFKYGDIKNVYTIIIFENSPQEFKKFPNCYLHVFSQTSNSGLELDLLQKYYFIPLDIFQKNLQNNGIRNEFDAWLTFLTSDNPEIIISLIQNFPPFKVMYQELYELCQNIERVMDMFSKELLELDRNTVQYMIDIMQDEINEQKEIILKKEQELMKSQMQSQIQNQLTKALLEANRYKDLQRMYEDEQYRNELIREYELNMIK